MMAVSKYLIFGIPNNDIKRDVKNIKRLDNKFWDKTYPHALYLDGKLLLTLGFALNWCYFRIRLIAVYRRGWANYIIYTYML